MTPSLKYIPKELGDPYKHNIERFLGMEFPRLASRKVEDVMEAVMEEFLASKQYRIGPRPNPESEVLMREVVRQSVRVAAPIPVLIPSAAVKVPIGESADVAELSALKVLESLNQRIKQHYAPGVNIRIRMEDLTEFAISSDVPLVRQHVGQYIGTMTSLVEVLGMSDFVRLVPESTLAREKEFLALVNTYEPKFIKALNGDDREIFDRGWKGGVSAEMRQYLRDRYAKLYPGQEEKWDSMMARYFSSILARRNLGAVGIAGERLEISFANPLPDAPLVSTRVVYRTVPRSQSSFHAPFWNAKGFLKINGDGVPRITLGAWEVPCTQGQLELSNGATKVLIRADYALE